MFGPVDPQDAVLSTVYAKLAPEVWGKGIQPIITGCGVELNQPRPGR